MTARNCPSCQSALTGASDEEDVDRTREQHAVHRVFVLTTSTANARMSVAVDEIERDTGRPSASASSELIAFLEHHFDNPGDDQIGDRQRDQHLPAQRISWS